MVAVTSDPINVTKLYEDVCTPESGGIDVFVGTVRNSSGGKSVQSVEYTAYLPMAEKQMALIEQEVRRQWDVHEVALVHRIGVLEVGEVAVVTAVSATHRKEAFEACRYAIDRIKSIVPIWKKEIAGDGKILAEGQHSLKSLTSNL